SGTLGVIVVAGVAALMADRGLRLWKSGQVRVGIAYLLAFCLLLPIALLVAFGAYQLFTKAAANPDWELLGRISKTFKQTTNARIWWAVILSLPAYVWLRRFTNSSVFSLVFAVMTAWLWVVTLMRMGVGVARHRPRKILFPTDPGRAAVFRDGVDSGAASFAERLEVLLPDRSGFHIRRA